MSYFLFPKIVVVPTSKDVIVTNATMDFSTSPIVNRVAVALRAPHLKSVIKPMKPVSARKKFKAFRVTLALMERTICKHRILRDVPNVSALERPRDVIAHI